MTTPNIFEQLASNNQMDEFDFSQSNASETPFKDVISSKQEEGNIFTNLAQKNEQKKKDSFGFLDYLRDIGEQVVTKGVAGIGGAYGNILDLAGLQNKPGEMTPGEMTRQKIESDILDKMNRGEKVSAAELSLLSSDENIPTSFRAPTSEDIKSDISFNTGIGEGKTAPGRIGGRIAEFVGEALPLGGASPKVLAAMGIGGGLGQSSRELGLPEGVATGLEVVSSILPSAISKKLIPSGRQAKELAEGAERIGLSAKQTTPLLQSEKKIATLSKAARKGEGTKKLFASIKESLGDSYDNLKKLPESRVKISSSSTSKIRNRFYDVIDELEKTLEPSPEKKEAIDFIKNSIKKLNKKGTTGEELINFWQDINKTVKWNSISGGKQFLSQLKKPILETLESISPQIARDFEITNQLYSRYSQISKRLKPDIVDAFVNKAEILGLPTAIGSAFVTGNVAPLVGVGSEIAIRTLATELLTNPYFQNIGKKLVVNFNQGSGKAARETVKQAKEYLQRKHPNEDWSFLDEATSSQ